MAVGRQLNVKGQMRIDVPHLRLIESGVVYDFDTLAGGILAGKLPYVVTGFVPAAWVVGAAASSLSLVTADSIFVNYQASENGSMLMVPGDRAPEQLSITNSRVSGNFTVSQTNYISLDLTRTEDATTSDVVHFIDPATGQGTPKIIPLGRTMDYQIHITTSPFSTNPQRCPVMIVETDASNNIVSVSDARPMMFRLAAGGDTPSALSKYAWPEGRNVGVGYLAESSNFTGGDKAIGDMKSWISAVEEMIWQINAGEYWYSNTQMTSTWFMPGSINDWTWNGTTLTWANPLTIVFTGSTAITNTIAAGSINLIAGNAAYVDFNRYTDGAALTVYQAPIQTMGGEPATPGIRYPFAWRLAAGSPAIRNLPVPAGAAVVGIATTTTYGSVKLSTADANPYAVVASIQGGYAIATGITRGVIGVGALQIGVPGQDSTVNVGTGLTGAATNSIYIGNGHGGTALSGIQIGQAGRGTLGMYGSSLYINDAGTGCDTYIGHSGAGTKTEIVSEEINVNYLSDQMTLRLGGGGSVGNTITMGTGGTAGAATSISIGTNGGTSNLLYLQSHTIRINADSPASGAITQIGTASIREVYAYGATVGINSSGTGVTNIGSSGSGAVSITSGATAAFAIQLLTTATLGHIKIEAQNTDSHIDITANAANSYIDIGAFQGTYIGTGGTDGLVILGNASNKARANTATVDADNSLTLATKGYVDGVSGGAAWSTLTPSNGTWVSNGSLPSKFRTITTTLGTEVILRGIINAGLTPTTHFFTSAYHPTQEQYFPCIVQNSGGTNVWVGQITVGTDGKLYVHYLPATYGSSTYTICNADYQVKLDGIRWVTW